MRDIDIAGAAVAAALGYSAQYTQTQTQARLLCKGADKDAGQDVLIIELRVSRRKVPAPGTQEKEQPNAGKGTKSPGKPMTPHKSLLQSVID